MVSGVFAETGLKCLVTQRREKNDSIVPVHGIAATHAAKGPPDGGPAISHRVGFELQAAAWLRRRRDNITRPPSAATTPGNPAPTNGPGTGEAASRLM